MADSTLALIIAIMALITALINLGSSMLNARTTIAKIQSMIEVQLKPKETQATEKRSFRTAISIALAIIGILCVSFLLWREYMNTEPITRKGVFDIGLLFSAMVFNLLFIFITRLERRLSLWVDRLLTAIQGIAEWMEIREANR